MLTIPRPVSLRPVSLRRVSLRPAPQAGSALALAALLAAALGPAPLRADDGGPERPPGLIVLEERPSQKGLRVLGLHSPKPDPTSPGLVRVSLWVQQGTNASVRIDTVRCSTTAPMRLTSEGERWLLRELNPGGAITTANRVDHLVWWAVCHPELAGRDPATLQGVARQLGYSGTLRETEQLLPGRGR
jgi:hypothetical protein